MGARVFEVSRHLAGVDGEKIETMLCFEESVSVDGDVVQAG